MSREVGVPFLLGELRALLLLRAGFGGRAVFLEDEDELVVQLEDSVPGIGEGAHDRGPAGGMAGGDFLPDHGSEVVEADVFAELGDLGTDGDDLVASIVHGAGELVPDVDAEPAPGVEDPSGLVPDEVEVVDVVLVGVVEPDLVSVSVVLELPVGRGGEDEVDGVVRDFPHGAGVTEVDFVIGFHLSGVIARSLSDKVISAFFRGLVNFVLVEERRKAGEYILQEGT